MQRISMSGDGAAWTGFLVVAFGVVGLIGAFATFAAQLPFDRAAARSQAIDQAVAAMRSGDTRSLDALRPLLGDSAGRLLRGPGDITTRQAAERSRMLSELHQEAVDTGFRLRFVIAGFTATAALFGSMILSIARRREP